MNRLLEIDPECPEYSDDVHSGSDYQERQQEQMLHSRWLLTLRQPGGPEGFQNP